MTMSTDAEEAGPGTDGGPFESEVEWLARTARRRLRRTAYHEAGHAVACVARKVDFEWVAVRPLLPHQGWLDDEVAFKPNYLGVLLRNGDLCPSDARFAWLDRLLFILAGPVAEARYAGSRRITVTGPDRDAARYYAGLAGQWDPAQVVRDGHTLARHLVEERWPEIDAVARALIERRYQSARQVRRIVKFTRRYGRPGAS